MKYSHKNCKNVTRPWAYLMAFPGDEFLEALSNGAGVMDILQGNADISLRVMQTTRHHVPLRVKKKKLGEEGKKS